VEVVTWQFHRALFMDGVLDLIEFQRMNPGGGATSPRALCAERP
jgi:hypothetical protein